MDREDEVDIIIPHLRNEKEKLKSILQWIIITVLLSIEIQLQLSRIRITLIKWHLLRLSATWTQTMVPLSPAHFEPRNNINNHTPSNISPDPSRNTPTLFPQNHISLVPPPSVKVPTISFKIPRLQFHHTIIPISTMRCNVETDSNDIPLTI